MVYELIISERADELIDRLTAYLLNHLKNPGAAAHFLDELESIQRGRFFPDHCGPEGTVLSGP